MCYFLARSRAAITKAPLVTDRIIIGVVNTESFEFKGPCCYHGIPHITSAYLRQRPYHDFPAIFSPAPSFVKDLYTGPVYTRRRICMTDKEERRCLLRIGHDTGILAVSKIPADADDPGRRGRIRQCNKTSDQTGDGWNEFEQLDPAIQGCWYNDRVAFSCFATTIVKDLHTDFILPGVFITVTHNILARIIFGVIDTGIPVIPERPADPRGLAVIIMLWQRPEISLQRIIDRTLDLFKIGTAMIRLAHLYRCTFAGFATAVIKDLHTNFIQTAMIIPVTYRIQAGIIFRVVDAGIAAITECPADPCRFTVIIMLR
jgi:hypothetical protein